MPKLAIHGGSREITTNFELEWPIITEEDINAIKRVVDSRVFWGKENEEVLGLEREYCQYERKE